MDYRFIGASGGRIPNGAQPHGREADGTSLWVARSPGNTIPNNPLGRTIQPGKVRQGFGAALIPCGGNEVPIGDYEVLFQQGIWTAGSEGQIPDAAIVCGREDNGDPLFVARAFLNGGLHPGKIRFGFGAALIGFGGVEVQVGNYEVLVSQDGLR